MQVNAVASSLRVTTQTGWEWGSGRWLRGVGWVRPLFFRVFQSSFRETEEPKPFLIILNIMPQDGEPLTRGESDCAGKEQDEKSRPNEPLNGMELSLQAVGWTWRREGTTRVDGIRSETVRLISEIESSTLRMGARAKCPHWWRSGLLLEYEKVYLQNEYK